MLVLHSADRIDSLCSCTCRSFSRSYRPSMPHERLGHCFSEALTSRFTLTRWRLTSATSRGMPVHSTGPRSSRVSFLQSAPSAALFTRCVSRQECAPSRPSVDGPGITLELGTVGHQNISISPVRLRRVGSARGRWRSRCPQPAAWSQTLAAQVGLRLRYASSAT